MDALLACTSACMTRMYACMTFAHGSYDHLSRWRVGLIPTEVYTEQQKLASASPPGSNPQPRLSHGAGHPRKIPRRTYLRRFPHPKSGNPPRTHSGRLLGNCCRLHGSRTGKVALNIRQYLLQIVDKISDLIKPHKK